MEKFWWGGGLPPWGGQPRNYIGQFNADGSLDTTFNPGASYIVNCLAAQADGKILVGGQFTTLGTQTRKSVGRLNNTEPATQDLSFDGSTISWLRGGASPEVWRTSFDVSTNGSDWVNLGAGQYITRGWQVTGLDFPTNATVRARGFLAGGHKKGSGWFVECAYPQVLPWIIVNDSSFGTFTNGFGFDFAGSAGSTVVVEGSTNLEHWLPLQTNIFGTGPLHFTDPVATNCPARFYRVRLAP